MAKFVCKQCLNKFISYDLTNNKFCSRHCYWNSMKKIKVSVCKTCGKTRESWREYKYCSRECMRQDMKVIRLGKNNPMYGKTGRLNPAWKGDSVGYTALHDWVKSRLGKMKECVYCGSENNIDWANVSHEYKRDLEDWIPLCKKCHFRYDKQDFGKSKKSILKERFGLI